jgi:gluconate kinase
MDRLTDAAQLDGWIPARLYWNEGRPMVDWCYLGRRRFEASFFEQTVTECLQHPSNLLFRHQTPIETLCELSELRPGLKPNGFIFHMSRCGSTLVSRMLAALRKHIVISEARPIDSLLRARFNHAEVTDDQRVAWLRWMVNALGQQRLGGEERFFIKFDAWNTVDIPLIRRAFPDVPWIFVYREPVEVLVSQLAHRGAHMIPGVIHPSLFAINGETIAAMESEEYCARVLAAICQAALQHHASGGSLINYKQLPEVVWSTVLGLFGVACSEDEVETLKDTAKLHAKNPVLAFQDDSAVKQESATAPLRKAANRWLYPIYKQLEEARLRAKTLREPARQLLVTVPPDRS